MSAWQVEFLISGIIDSSGDPLANGKVYFYEPGTTTLKTIWTDQAKTAASVNPVVLDARGSAKIFADGQYDIKIDDVNGNNITTLDDQLFKDNFDIQTDTSQPEVSNSTTETNLFSEEFDGTLLTSTSLIELFYCGDVFNNDTNTFDLTLRIKITDGTTTETVFEGTFVDVGTHATYRSVFQLESKFFGNQAANHVASRMASSDYVAGGSSIHAGLGGETSEDLIAHDTYALTFSGTDNIIVTGQLSNASANFDVRGQAGYLKILL